MLVDTPVRIDFFNGHGSAVVRLLAASIADGEPIEVPGIVLVEILSGLRNDAQAAPIGCLLEAFDELPEPERGDCLEAARISGTGRSRAHAIRSTIDCPIAQGCLRHDLALLTRRRDFLTIAGYTELRLVELST